MNVCDGLTSECVCLKNQRRVWKRSFAYKHQEESGKYPPCMSNLDLLILFMGQVPQHTAQTRPSSSFCFCSCDIRGRLSGKHVQSQPRLKEACCEADLPAQTRGALPSSLGWCSSNKMFFLSTSNVSCQMDRLLIEIPPSLTVYTKRIISYTYTTYKVQHACFGGDASPGRRNAARASEKHGEANTAVETGDWVPACGMGVYRQPRR